MAALNTTPARLQTTPAAQTGPSTARQTPGPSTPRQTPGPTTPRQTPGAQTTQDGSVSTGPLASTSLGSNSPNNQEGTSALRTTPALPGSAPSTPGASTSPGEQPLSTPSNGVSGTTPVGGSTPAGGSTPVGGSTPAGGSTPMGGSTPGGGGLSTPGGGSTLGGGVSNQTPGSGGVTSPGSGGTPASDGPTGPVTGPTGGVTVSGGPIGPVTGPTGEVTGPTGGVTVSGGPIGPVTGPTGEVTGPTGGITVSGGPIGPVTGPTGGVTGSGGPIGPVTGPTGGVTGPGGNTGQTPGQGGVSGISGGSRMPGGSTTTFNPSWLWGQPSSTIGVSGSWNTTTEKSVYETLKTPWIIAVMSLGAALLLLLFALLMYWLYRCCVRFYCPKQPGVTRIVRRRIHHAPPEPEPEPIVILNKGQVLAAGQRCDPPPHFHTHTAQLYHEPAETFSRHSMKLAAVHSLPSAAASNPGSCCQLYSSGSRRYYDNQICQDTIRDRTSRRGKGYGPTVIEIQDDGGPRRGDRSNVGSAYHQVGGYLRDNEDAGVYDRVRDGGGTYGRATPHYGYRTSVYNH